MTKTFFTSDHHFGHENILVYSQRPFRSVEEMNEKLISNWNSVVKPEDTVIHLGDLCIKSNVNKMLSRLNGSLVWVKGNHDKKPIINDLTIKMMGFYWHLLHNPSESDFERVIHGHVHDLWRIKREGDRLLINVGVDVWDYTPVSKEKLLRALIAFEQEEKL